MRYMSWKACFAALSLRKCIMIASATKLRSRLHYLASSPLIVDALHFAALRVRYPSASSTAAILRWESGLPIFGFRASSLMRCKASDSPDLIPNGFCPSQRQVLALGKTEALAQCIGYRKGDGDGVAGFVGHASNRQCLELAHAGVLASGI